MKKKFYFPPIDLAVIDRLAKRCQINLTYTDKMRIMTEINEVILPRLQVFNEFSQTLKKRYYPHFQETVHFRKDQAMNASPPFFQKNIQLNKDNYFVVVKKND